MKNLIVCLSLAAYCLFSTTAFSQTTFTGAVSDDWADAGNWDNGLPSEGNDATIPEGLTVVNNGTIEIFGPGGIVTPSTTILNFGTINNEGVIDNNGNIYNQNEGVINNEGTIENDGNISNYGGTINNSSSAYINNFLGAIYNHAGGEINNSGAIENLAYGSIYNWGIINNYGTITNHQGVAKISNFGTITNFGTISNFENIYNYSGAIINQCGTWIGSGPVWNNYTTENCPVFGCTDSTACNYDSSATEEDNSCWYLDLLINGSDVDEYANCFYENPFIDLSVSQPLLSMIYSENIEWTSGVVDGAISANITTDAPLQTTEYSILVTLDGYTCESSVTVYVDESCSEGCTDSTACNFNDTPAFDDGSCVYPPVIDLGDDIETCDESVTLDAGAGYDSYQWSNGETTQTIEVSESGDYSVEVGNGVSADNYSLNFDGEDDYVIINEGSDFFGSTGDFSASCWISLNENIPGNQGPWAQTPLFDANIENELHLMIVNDNGRLTVNCGGGLISESVALSWDPNTWYYVSITVTSQELKFYRNGIELGYSQQPYAGDIDSRNFDNILLGGSFPAPFFFDGLISDFVYWDESLSELQIQEYMSCPPAGNEAGLVGYWNFEEGSGTTAFDQTSNGNDGIINGATYNTDVPDADCNNCSSTDAITVTLLSEGCMDSAACNYDSEAGCDDGSCVYPPVIDLGDDIETCDESVTLDAGAGYDSYLWSNGETTQTIEVSESGDYSVEVGNGVSADNYSLNFDGEDDYVIINEGSDFFGSTGDFSASCWISLNENIPGNQGPWAQTPLFDANIENELHLMIVNDNGRLTVNCGGGLISESVALSWDPNTWYYVSITVTSQELKFYRNGIELGYSQQPYAGDIDSRNFDNILLGGSFPAPFFFDGLISDFVYWDESLSELQIQEYMSCPPAGNEAGLVGYWNFEEGSGTTAFDQTSNGNDGTINGADWSTDVPNTDFTTCSSTDVPNADFTICSSTDVITVTLLSEGCMDSIACNYDSEAGCDDQSCTYSTEDYLDCNGDCLNDDNNNGICDELEIFGCIFEGACNYNPEANVSDNSCYFATALYDCNGECQQDSDGDGICDQNESLECQGSDCCGEGTVWNPATQSCVPFNPCPFDSNDDGFVNTMDLLPFLVAFDSPCQ